MPHSYMKNSTKSSKIAENVYLQFYTQITSQNTSHNNDNNLLKVLHYLTLQGSDMPRVDHWK